MTEWQDLMVGDRMAVDREFSGRVAESEFSSQEWGLVMTATDFRVVDAEDPERARLVADTSKVEQIVPELQNIQDSAGAMGPGGPAGGPGRSDAGSGSGSGSGIIGSVKDALGVGSGSDDDGDGDTEAIVRRADRLTDEYADLLQERLEAEGKWERIRTLAAETAPAADESASGDATTAGNGSDAGATTTARPADETGDGDGSDHETDDDRA
jgi:hypothetical protein